MPVKQRYQNFYNSPKKLRNIPQTRAPKHHQIAARENQYLCHEHPGVFLLKSGRDVAVGLKHRSVIVIIGQRYRNHRVRDAVRGAVRFPGSANHQRQTGRVMRLQIPNVFNADMYKLMGF